MPPKPRLLLLCLGLIAVACLPLMSRGEPRPVAIRPRLIVSQKLAPEDAHPMVTLPALVTTTTVPVTTTTAPPQTTTTWRTTTTAPHRYVVSPRPTAPPVTRPALVAYASTDPYTTACWPSVGMAPRNQTETCISAREHGGCYDRSANPHQFGRWQLSAGLWATYAPQYDHAPFTDAHGVFHPGWPGITYRWGSAGPLEQDAVFVAVVAADGYSPYLAYDGC